MEAAAALWRSWAAWHALVEGLSTGIPQWPLILSLRSWSFHTRSPHTKSTVRRRLSPSEQRKS
jgi:hypothetical protein